MSSLHHVGALQVSQDLVFQRRMWTIQRVGWGVMAAILLAALAGLFGVGPLSGATASEDGFRVDYARFVRYRSPGILKFTLPAEATASGEVRLWLERDAVEAIQIEGIVPEPNSVAGSADRIVYVFKAAEPGQAMVIEMELTQQALGTRTTHAGIVGGPEVSFWQLTYP